MASIDSLSDRPGVTPQGGGPACGAILEGAPDAILVVDGAGILVGFNGAAESLFGRPHEAVIGRPVTALLLPGQGDWRTLLDSTRRVALRATCITGDGRPFDAEIRSSAVEVGEDRLTVSIVRDLSGRTGLEAALLEAEERFASITANMPGIVFQRVMRPDGGLYYPFFTAGLTEILGFTPEEVQVNAQGCLHFVHWADRDSHVAAIRRSAAELAPCVEEFRAITQGGEMRWLRGTSRPQRLPGGDILWDGVLIDITERKQAELRLEMIMDHAADCIITIDDQGNIESVNAAVERLFGYAAAEMVGQSVSMLMPEPFRSRHATYINRYVETGEAGILGSGPRELMGMCKDGTPFPMELATSEVRMEGRRIFIGIGRDVTQRKLTEAALRESEQRLRNIASNVPGIVYQRVMRPDGSLEYTFVSEGSRHVLGVEPAELIVHPGLFLEMLAPEHRDFFLAALKRSAETLEPFDEEIRLIARDGRERWLRGQSRPRRQEGGVVMWDGVTLDVTDRKLAEEQLQFLAYYDPVTKAGNRALFQERFVRAKGQADRNGTWIAVLSLGIDRFSIFNTTLGHAAGDRLLASAAARLQMLVGPSDLVARAGGDRFLVMLTGLNSDREVQESVEVILAACKEPLVVEREEFDLTTSIGAAIYPRHGDDADTLIKNADAALLRAKSQGPGSAQLFSEELNARAVKTLSLHNRLRRALDHGEIVAFYQPQVDVMTGRMVGMEALARWHSPDLGMVSPGEFIPVAEEYGLIEAVCEAVLRDACRQNKSWQDRGIAQVPVAVNISGRQFQNSRRLVYMLESILDETGLESRYLELELTESSAMRDADNAIAVVNMLREMGLSSAIDDFGTGYSSLSVLKRFPIHKLKIDRSFVMDVTTDVNDAAIVNAIIAMAHALKLKVVAEGVEEMAHLDFLRDLGCDQIQGYLFSRPLPGRDMEALFVEGRSLPVPA